MINTKKIVTIAQICAVVAFGWFANDFTRYVIEMHRKASVCDEIKCDKIVEMSETMKTLEIE